MSISDRKLQIQSDLIENYNNYAEGLDSKNWPMVRACFDDKVFIDYGVISDATGSPDVARNSDDWLKLLQGNLLGFDTTRHMMTNFRFDISDDEVTCKAYLKADHIIFPNPEIPSVTDEDNITVVGEYTNSYREVAGQWKIYKSKLAVNWTTGNLNLFEMAQARAAEK